MSSESFPIQGLRGSPPSLKTLKALIPRCQRMPEHKNLCLHLLDRLQYLHNFVAPLDAGNSLKLKYIDVIVRFIKLMRSKPLLLRLASNEALVAIIRDLQLKLSEMGQELELSDIPEMTRWSEQWEIDRAQQFGTLNEMVTKESDRILVNAFEGNKKLQEALMALNSSMNQESQSPEMLELKKTTFDRVIKFFNKAGMKMFHWFIAIDDIEYEDETIGCKGTFGNVRRGSWFHDGARTEVVVKLLFPETSKDSDEAFLRQLELWGNLPDDPHVLKLYGGSHVSNPQFYVCENAHYGNLVEFLADRTHNVIFWRLFKQVAQGLEFLHKRNIVHGGLKCANVLIGANYTAKLADFGFSTVRTLSASLSDKAGKANEAAVRWQPKEVLEENSADKPPRFESDIYGLGMCMIEAKTDEIPFGTMEDADVMVLVMSGQRHPRSNGLLDAEWDFISRLCESDYTKRPTLDQVLQEITAFANNEEQQHPAASIA